MNKLYLDQQGLSPILIILILVVFGGAVGGAYILGTKQFTSPITSSIPAPSPEVSVSATPQITSSPTVAQVINSSPLPSVRPSLQPASAKITIPADWKTYSVDDVDYNVRTSMSLPPEFAFEVTYGWTFHIFSGDSTEDWDHLTSIYRKSSPPMPIDQYQEEPVLNHYDGSSRRAWYQKNKLDHLNYKIISTEELPMSNGSTYLKLQVQEQERTNIHYLYVENGIMHILVYRGSNPSPELPKVLDKVFYSMKSIKV